MKNGFGTEKGKADGAEAAFVAGSASVVGDVVLGRDASIWYGAVIRGDLKGIRIGERSNIQDGAILHVTRELGVDMGEDVTVGHGAILHGCTVERECLIGMGAIILDGALIGEGSIVAAGSLVPERRIVPPGSLVMGTPATVVREVRLEERQKIRDMARAYVELARAHKGQSNNVP